ncbi:VTT domain-containing protein [Aestuariimicrobium soli]|uniref:VTT domain-containing protein n=1 Tax=Aestuariimicrobium soli TaxID=2035834 RepID=UPI003EBA0D7F
MTWLQALVTWHQWVEVASSIGYGILSSIVPIFHTEAFIVAAVGSKVLGPIELSIGLAIGHAIGKQMMFQAVRRGRNLPWMRKHTEKEVDPDSWRAKWRRWSTKTAHLVENPRWGYPILFVSAATGIPPVYATVLFAGATKMSFWGFSAVMLVGFFIRCLALAFATLGAFQGIFG